MHASDADQRFCCKCAGELSAVDDCDAGEIGALISRLAEATFQCEKCASQFHGRCGAVGTSARRPGFAMLSCPHCGRQFEQTFPFQVRQHDG